MGTSEAHHTEAYVFIKYQVRTFPPRSINPLLPLNMLHGPAADFPTAQAGKKIPTPLGVIQPVALK